MYKCIWFFTCGENNFNLNLAYGFRESVHRFQETIELYLDVHKWCLTRKNYWILGLWWNCKIRNQCKTKNWQYWDFELLAILGGSVQWNTSTGPKMCPCQVGWVIWLSFSHVILSHIYQSAQTNNYVGLTNEPVFPKQ